MRVTNKMLSDSYLRDMQVNLDNLKILQRQMSSRKQINKPSDDPFKAARSMMLHAEINANEQYNANIKDTQNWLDVTDTALGQIGDVLGRIRKLLTSASNAGYTIQERTAIKDEINQKIGELAQILNTNFDGKYIFGGSRGTHKPVGALQDGDNMKLAYVEADGKTEFDIGDPQYKMIDKKLKTEVSQGVVMEYNVTANEIINPSGGKDLRKVLTKILNHLDGKSDDGTSDDKDAVNKLASEDLQDIIDAANNVLNLRSEVGAKQNRMESAREKNEDEKVSLTEILSKSEDIDITKITMEYATALSVYLASLRTSAKVIQPTLIDYIS